MLVPDHLPAVLRKTISICVPKRWNLVCFRPQTLTAQRSLPWDVFSLNMGKLDIWPRVTLDSRLKQQPQSTVCCRSFPAREPREILGQVHFSGALFARSERVVQEQNPITDTPILRDRYTDPRSG